MYRGRGIVRGRVKCHICFRRGMLQVGMSGRGKGLVDTVRREMPATHGGLTVKRFLTVDGYWNLPTAQINF